MSPLQKSQHVFHLLMDHYSRVPVHLGYTAFRVMFVLLILVSVSKHASAKGGFQEFQDDSKVPWRIIADEISYNDRTNEYIGRGNVVITKKNKNLSADYVRFNRKTMKAFADGHVMMTVGENILTGSSMDIDLNTETGTVYDGTIFFQKNHFYIRGDKIQKIGKDSYTAEKASVSTCDGNSPAWKITARNLKVTVEGYGIVKDAALWTKKVPVLYTPFLMFPVKLKRQSGLLTPQFGYDNRKGGVYVQPIYWAINESSDATFYSHYMSQRGEKLGLEYRYILDKHSKGTLMYDFLNDKKVDDGSPGSDQWGYDGDNALRPNSDRYWLRFKHDQSLPSGFFAALDIDFVSDQDYLYEFQYGYSGFDETRAYFNKIFHRELDEYDNPYRLNRFNINKDWPLYSFNAQVRWYDNAKIRRQEETDMTLQQLPAITFTGAKQEILSSPFYFDLGSDYTYFYSKDGPRGHRMDVYPRFYLPYRFKNYFFLEPSVGIRETVWNFDQDEYNPSDKNTQHRGTYDIKMDLSSKIYHIFKLNGEHIQKIKYDIRPQIVYDYIPEKDQSEFPWHDDLNRIGARNIITYSITNTLTSKSKINTDSRGIHPTDESHGEKSEKFPTYSYNPFCWFKLEQSYDFNKEKEGDPEPFSPITFKLLLFPKKYFSIDADAAWSPYGGDFLSRNIGASLWDRRGDRLFVSHRYQEDVSESLYTDLRVKITDRLSAFTEYERDIFNDNTLRFSLGFLYEAQCWSLYSNYIEEGGDHKIGFMIKLRGIGGIG